MESARIDQIIGNFENTRILVVGDIMMDRYLWGEVERISPEAPVPVVSVTNETVNVGGAANVAANVAALGAKAILYGVIGDDNFGEPFKKLLHESGIDELGLVVDKSRSTTVKTRIVAGSQQVVRIDRESVEEINNTIVDKIMQGVEKVLPDLDGIIISDYGKGVINYNLLTRLIASARAAGKFIAVDPKEVHFKNYKNVSVITPNHHEAGFVSGKRITNDTILDQVGWQLLDELQLESLLITRGKMGMSLFESDRTRTDIPVVAKTVFDVTGAGDTVIASLTVARSAGADMKEAAYISNVAAGLAVARIGTARISRDELHSALKDNR